jgi:hypothetical protein
MGQPAMMGNWEKIVRDGRLNVCATFIERWESLIMEWD